MCGIIGYIGFRPVGEVLTEGLTRLEYRGYDSVGIAVYHEDGRIEIKKDKGMIEEVSKHLGFRDFKERMGIGHTRWATHGIPCAENAHPHSSCNNEVVLVHNGVIENFMTLKEELLKKGHRFSSDTDSEVIAHLIEEELKSKDSKNAFLSSLRRLKGSFAIVALFKGEKRIFIARKGSPLIIGLGKDETLCASDIPAMLKYTKTFIPLEDGDVGILSAEGVQLFDLEGKPINRDTLSVEWDYSLAEKGGHPHFMLKEIFEQEFIYNSFSSDVSVLADNLRAFEKIHVIACGTSYHAGLVAKYLAAKHLSKEISTYIASEYPYVGTPDENTLVIAITQSGETADTLQAVRFAKEKKAKVIAITNIIGSSITRLADRFILFNAGPEISVAATKTFTAQLAIFYKAILKGASFNEVPAIIKEALKERKLLEDLAYRLKDAKNVFYLGRGINYPMAMEGALKFKEISYIHAEAYPGGELKHGPLSLIEEGIPVVVFAPEDETHEKILSNIKEVKARGGFIIAVSDSEKIKKESDVFIPVHGIKNKEFYPFYLAVILQLLAYYTSVKKGINPDKPRNLAKSVTVE